MCHCVKGTEKCVLIHDNVAVKENYIFELCNTQLITFFFVCFFVVSPIGHKTLLFIYFSLLGALTFLKLFRHRNR